MFQVRLATPDDQPIILDMIEEAAEWLKTKGTSQWKRPWPNENERDARVLRGLLAGRTWLVEDYGVPVATVTHRPDGNPDLWNEAELHEPAGYISRLIVSRKYAHTGTGAALADWAGARARYEYQAESLRIDVWTTNIPLHAYYKRQGFHFVRFCPDRNYPSAALFFKPTADIAFSAIFSFWEIPAIPAPA
jgi:ribosomal protein S18 acetylase RimI-like enzyme